MNFFEQAGLKLKQERGERVFPASDHSSDIIAALNRQMEKRHVQLLLHTPVKKLLIGKSGDGADKILGVKLENGKEILADAVVLATGGNPMKQQAPQETDIVLQRK